MFADIMFRQLHHRHEFVISASDGLCVSQLCIVAVLACEVICVADRGHHPQGTRCPAMRLYI
jgi:hypothetical protein